MKKILLTILLLGMSVFAQEGMEIKNVSKTFDVYCKENDTGNSILVIYKKGTKKEFQKFQVLGCSEPPEKGARDIYFEDYNFDGSEDVALTDGLNGGYNGPSYQVYLFSKVKNKFVKNAAFTKLAQGPYLGMFNPDMKKKMFFTWEKSGCCWHQTKGYKVINNKPVKVYELTETYRTDNSESLVTTKKLINGKWRSWGRKSATGIYFDKGKTSKTISVKLSNTEPIKWFKFRASKGQIVTVAKDSPDAFVSIVDASAINVQNDEYVYKIIENKEDLVAKLNFDGDYYLELSAEKNLTVRMTVTIE